MADLILPKDDYGYNLAFTVKDNDDVVIDITDYTVTAKIWSSGMDAAPIVSSACTPDVAASGTCHYTVQDGDFPNEGDYLIELELTKAGVVESTRNYTLTVEESA